MFIVINLTAYVFVVYNFQINWEPNEILFVPKSYCKHNHIPFNFTRSKNLTLCVNYLSKNIFCAN